MRHSLFSVEQIVPDVKAASSVEAEIPCLSGLAVCHSSMLVEDAASAIWLVTPAAANTTVPPTAMLSPGTHHQIPGDP